jgi:hypothetical protein
MKFGKQKSQQVPDQVIRNINPRFKSRLPDILEDICQGLIVIEPVIQQLAVPLREFLDYLDFEIEKVELEIFREELNNPADTQKLTDAKAWLVTLKSLRDDFQVDVMTSPVTFIRTMVDRVDKTFR